MIELKRQKLNDDWDLVMKRSLDELSNSAFVVVGLSRTTQRPPEWVKEFGTLWEPIEQKAYKSWLYYPTPDANSSQALNAANAHFDKIIAQWIEGEHSRDVRSSLT